MTCSGRSCAWSCAENREVPEAVWPDSGGRAQGPRTSPAEPVDCGLRMVGSAPTLSREHHSGCRCGMVVRLPDPHCDRGGLPWAGGAVLGLQADPTPADECPCPQKQEAPPPQVLNPWPSWSESLWKERFHPPAQCTETIRARTPLAQQPAAPHTCSCSPVSHPTPNSRCLSSSQALPSWSFCPSWFCPSPHCLQASLLHCCCGLSALLPHTRQGGFGHPLPLPQPSTGGSSGPTSQPRRLRPPHINCNFVSRVTVGLINH